MRGQLLEDEERENITLCELLDRVLNKGVVILGDVTISVADIDLLYLGLRLLLTSVETAARAGVLPASGNPFGSYTDGRS